MREIRLEPNERQKLFLMDTHRCVAFGGARGGGKSWAVRVKAISLADNYPGIKVLIVRRTYPELWNNHIKYLKELLGSFVRYNDTNKEFTFPNGSVIKLQSAQNEKEMTKFQGTECDVLFIDEATQLTEDQYDTIQACVRGPKKNMPRRIYFTCNPGGVGHQWVKRLFIDKKYRSGEHPDDYVMYKSLVTDNKALMESDPEYVAQLEALPPKLRKAWLEGDWNIFEGQFFEEFMVEPSEYECNEHGISREQALRERRWTHVIEPFRIPREWKIYRSFDFGYAKPFSCDWWAVDYDGIAYLFKQFYGCKTGMANEGLKRDPDWLFDQIHQIETSLPELKGRQIHGVADPSIWDKSRGDSIIELAYRHGVDFEPGDNKRIPGWMQCHYRLTFDEQGYPMVYFFNTCEAAIRTLPLLQYDEHNAEDLDTSQEDHFADSFRYFCMMHPIKPVHRHVPEARGDDPLDLYKRYY